MENTNTFENAPANPAVDSQACPTLFKIEFSEVGDPVPFKIIKLEENSEPDIIKMEIPDESEWMADTLCNQAGSSNMDHLESAKDLHSSVSSPPIKRTETETTLSAAPLKRARQAEDLHENMESMSSGDDAVTVDSDMEYDNKSGSDSEWDCISDSDDVLGAGAQDEGPGQKLDGPNSGDNFRSHHDSQVKNSDPPQEWLSDETSIKMLEFTKKRELLIPPPKDPYEAFRWFLNDEILDSIVNETNKHAALICNKEKIGPKSRLRSWKDVTRDEMIMFLALLIHTGTIRMNRINDYWKGDYLFNLNCFSTFMKRNRFMVLLNCLNFASPDPSKKDQFAKIRPIINNLNEKMKEIYYPGKELIIAKSMVFWHGRLVRQEYTDNRRLREAIKLFMLAEPNGPVVKYQVHAGNGYTCQGTTQGIVEDLLEDKLGHGHALYMDKYYSSYALAVKLLERQTYCTGTLNKRSKDNPFRRPPYNLCKQTHKSVFSNGVHIGKWQDSQSTLYYITTEYKNEFFQVVERNGTLCNRPRALVNYRKCMTGYELQDQLMSYQPCSRKSMLWYKKLFLHSLQIYMTNAFYLFNNYSGIKKNMSYYDFRLSVLKAMLQAPTPAPPRTLQMHHTLTKITRSRLRAKREADGQIRIVNEVIRKECKQCRLNKKKRTGTLFECTACEGSPGYCTTCFCEFHSGSGNQ